MQRRPINDTDRAQWIDNDEGLYSWWRQSRQSKRAFIQANRQTITETIHATLYGRRTQQSPIETPPASYPFCRRDPCPYWFGYCRKDPACND